jgi:hypothetical protein
MIADGANQFPAAQQIERGLNGAFGKARLFGESA